MAYEITEGAIIELAAEYQVNGQQNINLFHYKFESGPVIPSGFLFAIEMLNQLEGVDQLRPKHGACISEDSHVIYWYAQWISPTRYAYVADDSQTVPLAPPTMLPQNAAVVITKKGQEANRRNVGTLHIGGVPQDWNIDGNVAPAGLTAYNSLAAVLADDVIVAGRTMRPVLYHRADPAESAPIVLATTQPTMRVMRRRTVGLGT